MSMSLSIPLRISIVAASRPQPRPVRAIYRGIPVSLERVTVSRTATLSGQHPATYLYRGVQFTPSAAAASLPARNVRPADERVQMMYRGHRVG